MSITFAICFDLCVLASMCCNHLGSIDIETWYPSNQQGYPVGIAVLHLHPHLAVEVI